MFVEDLKNDFYNVLLGNRVLMLVHYDVDAICTCKILQSLFKCDNISYTLVPVGGVSELKKAFEENNEEIKYVVLVNCGGTLDLVDILQPEEDVVFFVLDSHKPSDICNVYSDGQVRLVYKDSEENIPNFDDIFRDDDEEEDEQPSEGGIEAMEALVEKRRSRREWEQRRHTLMFNYTQFSYHGKPSACVALELAWLVSRCGPGEVWAASVAVTSHGVLAARPHASSLLDASLLTRRLSQPGSMYQVVLENDVWLPLYRSWSLEEALRHSPVMSPHLKLHSLAGAARLRQLLVDMGIPLQQARQAYRSMDVELRRSLVTALETSAPKHQLPVPTRAAFILKRQHAPPIAAHDVVFAILGLIEHETIPRGEGFQHALAAIDLNGGREELRVGEESAKSALKTITGLVHSALASRRLLLAGPFRYYIVQEGGAGWSRGVGWLGVLARQAGAAAGGAPLVVCAPLAHAHCVLLGVPPRPHVEPRSLFGAAFEQAATKSGITVSLDFMDSSAIMLPNAQRAQFLDALTALLA